MDAIYAAVTADPQPPTADELNRILAKAPPGALEHRGGANKDETPVQAAHRLHRGELVGALVLAGADVKKLFEGATPLTVCIAHGQPSSVRALVLPGQKNNAAAAKPDEKVRHRPCAFMSSGDEKSFYCTALHLCVCPPERPPTPDEVAAAAKAGRPAYGRRLPPQLESLEILVREAGADINKARDSTGRTPVGWIVHVPAEHCESALDALLRLGADVSVRATAPMGYGAGLAGNTVLFDAIGYPYDPTWPRVACLRKLVDADARVLKAVDERGRPPLAAAVGNSRCLAVAQFLLDEVGVSVDQRNPETGETALSECASLPWNEGEEDQGAPAHALLLSRRADPSARDAFGQTPIFSCARFGHLPALRLLIAHGASVDARDAQGMTPLMVACDWYLEFNPSLEAVELLLARSSPATRRAVMFQGGGAQGGGLVSAVDLFITRREYPGGPLRPELPWDPRERRVISELLASGAPYAPAHARVLRPILASLPAAVVDVEAATAEMAGMTVAPSAAAAAAAASAASGGVGGSSGGGRGGGGGGGGLSKKKKNQKGRAGRR